MASANLYSGGTTIGNGGAIMAANATGSATGSGPVTVANGGNFAGGNGGASFGDSTQGFVAGQITVQSGGLLRAGTAGTLLAGVLTSAGSVTFQDGSGLFVALATANARSGANPADVNTNGRLVTPLDILFGGNLTLEVNGGNQTFLQGQTYDYYIGQDNGAGGLPTSVTFEPLQFASPVSPSEFSLTRSANGLDLILTFTPVPEPGTLALLGMAAAFGVWRRRRS